MRYCFVILFFGLSASGAVNLPLEVANWSDAIRTVEPVTAGVPLPQGAVYDLTKLRITDGSGNTVPAQFRWLSKWWMEKHRNGSQNPSVKWVLCDFQASVPAKNRTAFTLRDDNSAGAPATALTVTDAASGVTVVTGPLKFVVSKQIGNVFDGVWLDASGNGTFEAGEQIVAGSNQNGGFISAGDWAAQGCVAGTVHSTVQRAPERVIIEEQGPMKVLIRVEGRHYAASGGVTKGLYGYRIFYTAYAGKPFVDVQYAVTNTYTEFRGAATLGNPGYTAYAWPFRKYEVVLNLSLSASQTYRLLGASEVSGGLSATPVVLHQGRTAYTITGAAGGTTALGGAAISDGSMGIMAAQRDFGPNWPKQMRVAQNQLVLALFPDTTANYSLDPLSLKNHRLRFNFTQGAPSAGSLLTLWQQTDAPLRMLAAREWYRDTRAWDRGFGIPPCAGYNRIAPSAWTRLTKTMARGWKTFGYIGEFNGGGDHWNLTSCFWEHALIGNPAAFEDAESKAFYFNDIVQMHYGYNRFTDFSFYTMPEDHLQAFSEAPHPDVISQYINAVTYTGYIRNFPDTPPDNGHLPQMQEIEYYLLTGDPATRDAVQDVGVFAIMCAWYRTYGLYCGWPYSTHQGALVDLEKFRVLPYGPRYVARPVISANHAYEVTGDDRYFRPMTVFTYSLRNYTRLSPIGYLADPNDYTTYLGGANAIWTANHPGVNPPVCFSGSDFQIGIANEALYGYWRVSGDEKIRDALILSGKSFEWRAGFTGGRYTGFAYSGWGDYPCDGKRYSDVGVGASFTSSASEGFSGLIFGFLGSGRRDLYNVINDGLAIYPNFCPGGNTVEMKLINMWEAKQWHDAWDTVPPAKVTNLTAGPGPNFGVQLSWTAPGDDGSTGRASEYQVKYAKVPMADFVQRWNSGTQTGWPDLNNPLPYTVADLIAKADAYQATKEVAFWNAENVSGEPAPQNAGAPETHVINSLAGGTAYYFALVSFDDQGNVSDLSNVVSFTTAVESGKGGGDGFAVDGNIPNPFNPSTEIRFSPAGQPVSVAIYNCRGERVRTLAVKAGIHRVRWDGRDAAGTPLASGIYVCRIISGKIQKELRMALVK